MAAGFFPDSLTIPAEVCRDSKAEVCCHSSSCFFLFPCLDTSAFRPPLLPLKPAPTRCSSNSRSDEKIDLIGGVNDFYIRGIKHIGLPELKMADGPFGVRNYGPSTTFGGMGLAATWDPDLAQRMGAVIGQDARARGVHFMLGPGVNISRSPLCGRNFEYFGEDPFLASRTAVAYIKGMQSQGVSATIKHFMGNNQEFLRHDADSIIDERTMREIYLPTFEAAVKEAHVGAIMDSYNLINGEHATQNGRLNSEIAEEGVGLRRHRHVRLGRDLRWRGGGQRRARSRDAGGEVHESRHAAAGGEGGQGERGHD